MEEPYTFEGIDSFFEYWDYVEDLELGMYEDLTEVRVVSCRNPEKVKDVDDLINEARSDWLPQEGEYYHDFELADNSEELLDGLYEGAVSNDEEFLQDSKLY